MSRLFLFLLLVAALASAALAQEKKPKTKVQPIAIADVKRDQPVDFEKDVLPIFRKNCLACHNATEAEGKLVLEHPASILKGGSSGAAVVAGKGAESLLLIAASRQKEPYMPPPDNDVGAKALTSDELGLIKLWVDQGAKGEVKAAPTQLVWQALPPGVNPIYAVSVTADGQYAAAARANQIFLYHVPSKRELGRLTDPALLANGPYKKPGVAHLDLVQSLTFNPAGDLLASGSFREVKLWRRPTNVKLRDLAGGEAAPKSFAATTDGKFAAWGEENGKIKIIDLSNGQATKTLEGQAGPVAAVAYSFDGALVASASGKMLMVHKVADGALLLKVETAAPIAAVAFAAEDKQIATGHEDKMVRSWATPAMDAKPEGEAPKPLKEIAGHNGPVTALASIGNTPNVLSGCQDGNMRIVDLTAGTAAKTMAHGQPITAVAATANGKRFAAAGATSVKLFGENNQAVAEIKGDYTVTLAVAAKTREVGLGKRHVDNAKKDLDELTKRKKAEEDTQKKNADAKTKAEEEFKKKEEAAKKPVEDKAAADRDLEAAKAEQTKAEEAKKVADQEATTADADLKKAQADKAEADKGEDAGKKEAAAKDVAEKDEKNKAAAEKKKTADKAVADATKKATDADAKVKQATAPAQKALDEKNAAERAMQAAMRSMERSAESLKTLDTEIPAAEKTMQGLEEAAKLLEAAAADMTKKVAESEKPVKLVAFSGDGKLLAIAGEDQVVRTFDAATGAWIGSFSGQGAAHLALAFAGPRELISVAANKNAAVWDTMPEWKLERTIGNPDSTAQFVDRVTALDFSPTGEYLATGGGEPSRSGELKVWKVADGTLLQEFKDAHSDAIYAAEFSPDGKYIATCAADRFMKTFEVATGKFVRSFEGHTHHVLGVSWQMDGRVLASAGADKVVKVWDFRTGDQQRTIQGYNKEVTQLRFLRDPAKIDRFVSASGDMKVKLMRAGDGGSEKDFPGATDYVYAVAVSADGNTVIGGGADSVVRLWSMAGNGPAVSFDPPKAETPAAPAAK